MSDPRITLAATIRKQIRRAILAVIFKIASPHRVHVGQHVGMFAGSLLQLADLYPK